MKFSSWGERIRNGSGIGNLMDDLGSALAADTGHLDMLGGGNPAIIPEIARRWRELMHLLLVSEPERFDRMLGIYDTQQGNPRFCQAVASLFNQTFGWSLTPENIAITNGGQTAYFFLFNLLAGTAEDGSKRRILFPSSPEYIGYADQMLEPHCYLSVPSSIELIGQDRFKYHVDFDALPADTADIAAACLSRPTNPTANVLSDAELQRLYAWCRQRQIPLILDNAYGTPFPNLVYNDAQPFWGEGVILTYSLSKLGLPGTRTGIVIGPPEIIATLGSINAIAGLANGNIGQQLTLPLFESGEILELCAHYAQPYYQSRSEKALAAAKQAFQGIPHRIHLCQGAFFLWLWLPELTCGSAKVYQACKQAGVVVVPGHYFFYGLEQPWAHAQQCLRISYAMDIEGFPSAIKKVADVVRELA